MLEELERIESPVNLSSNGLAVSLGFCDCCQLIDPVQISLIGEERHSSISRLSESEVHAFDLTSSVNEKADEPLQILRERSTFVLNVQVDSSDKESLDYLGSIYNLNATQFVGNNMLTHAIMPEGEENHSYVDISTLFSSQAYNMMFASGAEVEQDVPINAVNDHGADIVKYAAVNNRGAPILDANGNQTYFRGYIPVNYEYDFAYPNYSATEDDLRTLTLVPADPPGEPEALDIIKVEWKFNFTPGTNTNRGLVSFWKGDKKLEALAPSDEWHFTPNPSVHQPTIQGVALIPCIEGTEPSRAIGDVGTATYSIRLTMADNSISIVNYKPVKLSATPILEKLTTTASELPPTTPLQLSYNAANLNKFEGPIQITSHVIRSTLGQKLAFIQFLKSVTNDATGKQSVVHTNPVSNQKYVIDNQQTDPFPVKRFPFVDCTEAGQQDPYYQIPASLTGGDQVIDMYDAPSIRQLGADISQVKFTDRFRTYCVLPSTNIINGTQREIVYPITSINWSVVFDITNIVYDVADHIMITTYQSNDSGVYRSSSAYTHQFNPGNTTTNPERVSPVYDIANVVVLQTATHIENDLFDDSPPLAPQERYYVYD